MSEQIFGTAGIHVASISKGSGNGQALQFETTHGPMEMDPQQVFELYQSLRYWLAKFDRIRPHLVDKVPVIVGDLNVTSFAVATEARLMRLEIQTGIRTPDGREAEEIFVLYGGEKIGPHKFDNIGEGFDQCSRCHKPHHHLVHGRRPVT